MHPISLCGFFSHVSLNQTASRSVHPILQSSVVCTTRHKTCDICSNSPHRSGDAGQKNYDITLLFLLLLHRRHRRHYTRILII